MAMNLKSGCDYEIEYIDGTTYEFKFWDNSAGIKIEIPPGSGNFADLSQEIPAHGGWQTISFLGCP